jgi:hypothetical protein
MVNVDPDHHVDLLMKGKKMAWSVQRIAEGGETLDGYANRLK